MTIVISPSGVMRVQPHHVDHLDHPPGAFECGRCKVVVCQWCEGASESVLCDECAADRMDFGSALRALKAGKKVARDGWNGKGMWLGLQVPDEHSKMGLPYIFMSTVTGQLVPWLASQTDVLADDWRELELDAEGSR